MRSAGSVAGAVFLVHVLVLVLVLAPATGVVPIRLLQCPPRRSV
jgi:hypothetical protein